MLDFVKYKMLIYNRKDKIYAIEGKQTGQQALEQGT